MILTIMIVTKLFIYLNNLIFLKKKHKLNTLLIQFIFCIKTYSLNLNNYMSFINIALTLSDVVTSFKFPET